MDIIQSLNKGFLKECCVDPKNLVKFRIAWDKQIEICKVCRCKHYRVIAETGQYFARRKR